MKKILTIALIVALCLTSAFAVSFTGSASLELGYDLDSKDYGFKNAATPKLIFGFELGSGEGGAAGEKDLRAEIAGTFAIEFDENDEDSYYVADQELKATVTTLKISKANILYKDILTVGILSAGKSANYASSYNVDDDGNTLSDIVASLSGVYVKNMSAIWDESALKNTYNFNHTTPGFTVSAFGVNGGFGFNGNATENKSWYTVLAHAALADKAIGENFKLSVGAAGEFTGIEEYGNMKVNVLQANAKAAYTYEKLSASAALDFGAAFMKAENAGDVEPAIALEAAAAAAYDFVSVNAYLYHLKDFSSYSNIGDNRKFDTTILDAKIAAEKTFAENYTVGGSFELDNAANETRYSYSVAYKKSGATATKLAGDLTDVNDGKREYTLAVNGKAVVEAFTFTADLSYGFDAKKIAVNAGVAYKNNYVSTNVGAHFDKVVDADNTSVFYFTAGISSDAVVDGATLALTYGKASSSDKLNLLKDQATAQKLGKITASAKVSF